MKFSDPHAWSVRASDENAANSMRLSIRTNAEKLSGLSIPLPEIVNYAAWRASVFVRIFASS
jgi:hypothetical protein